MIGLFVLFVEQKMDPPTLEEFSWFYTLKSCQGDFGFYYFLSEHRRIFGLLSRSEIVLVLGKIPIFTRLMIALGVALPSQVSFL